MKIKPASVVKHMEIRKIGFSQGSVGTHIRRGGQYIFHIVGNSFRISGVTLPKVIEIS